MPGDFVERLRDLPVFAVFTHRPWFEPPWSRVAHVTSLSLNHLSKQDCRALASHVASELSAEAVADIVERADGVALFIEELSRAVLDSGATNDVQIPVTLRDALTARLDHLGSARALAQEAAVLGRTFKLATLKAQSEADAEQVERNLDVLLASGLIYKRSMPSGDAGEFKHALVRDVAYSSMLRPGRELLHRRAAQVLLDSEGESQHAVLARHWAGRAGRARSAVLFAGRSASVRLRRLRGVSRIVPIRAGGIEQDPCRNRHRSGGDDFAKKPRRCHPINTWPRAQRCRETASACRVVSAGSRRTACTDVAASTP
jgi:hypothetical protein